MWWWCGGGGCGADNMYMDVSLSINHHGHAPNYGGRVPVDTTPGPAPVCRALKTHPITPRTAPSGVKVPPSHDMATQAPGLHIGATEPVQSANAEHVETPAAVATMVQLATVTVKDNAACSK